MRYVSELIIGKDIVTKEDFLEFYNTVAGHIGNLRRFRFHIILSQNHIRYYVESDKNLETLTSSAHFAVLQPVDEDTIKTPIAPNRERFVNFGSGTNLLSMQEKIAVKRGKHLEHFVCDIRKINFEYAKVSMQLYFKGAAGEYSIAIKRTNRFPAHLFALNFETSNNFMKTEPPKYLNIENVQLYYQKR